MATAPKLRDQARAAENKDQWREAANLYRQLLQEEPEGEEVDIALWNRVGDLHLRVNETDRAVEAYERAVSAYADSGLYNNAIALCRKLLRIVPGRTQVYHKLGQISAAAGFVADARQNFLEYAERMKKAGKAAAAFEALREFADLSQDVGVRRVLAEQLLAHGQRDPAIEQFRILLGAAVQGGDDAAAQALREQIRGVDPNADDSPLLRNQAHAVDDFRAALHDGRTAARAKPADAAELPALDLSPTIEPAAVNLGGGEDDGDVPRLLGLESTALDAGPPAPAPRPPSRPAPEPPRPSGLMGLDGGTLDFEPTSLDFPSLDDGDDGRGHSLAGYPNEEDAGDPLPLMGLDDGEDAGGDLPLMDSGDFGGDSDGYGGDAGGYGGRLPLMDDDADDEDGGGDLPLMSFDDEPAAPPPPPPARRAPPRRRVPDPEPAFVHTVDRLEDLRAHVAAEPADEASRDELVRELRARGLAHDVEGVLENAHRALAARGMYYEAVAPITALIGLRPDDGLLLQKRVEYAFRSGRPEPQVEAYLDLGRHFARHGHDGKAAAVFKRVLELDPHNVEARAAAAQLPAPAAPAPRPAAPPAPAPVRPAAPPPAPAAPPENEYVDLGALILGDDDEGEASTRFIVEEKEPSGDEDKDFAEMLASFRQKVAENIDVEDNASHYDLGVAFMEMGLIDEAISEFQVALRGGAKPLATLELLGQCFVEKAQYAVAGRVLDRALKLPGVADGDLVGVLYLLGRVDEGTGRPDTALEHYERVVSVDIRFRDTAQRVDRLRASRGAA